MNNYFENNKDKFLNELLELLKIPSISADSNFKNEVRNAAEFIKTKLIKAGANKAELFETKGHPIVYGEKIFDINLPTVLVYGHYDVQPVDPLNLWNNPPFEPTIIDGKVYARGASDDKGQMYMHIKALEILLTEQSLKCNIKFMIEGEEEIGSDNLGIFVNNNKELLKADVILISDTCIVSNDCPSITVGLRGLSYVEVEVTGPNRDLHSGMYGGAVANPINVLCEMIAKMHNEKGEITIPGFYDKVLQLTESEKIDMAKIPYNEDEYKKALEINDTKGELGYTTIERISARPTLDVNGIWGGYTGEGAKTVLPSKAFAKISMRLVPNQSSEEITNLFSNYFQSIAPESVKVKVTPHHGGEPVLTSSEVFGFKAAEKAFENIWGKKPILTREGGSIPIVALFKSELGLDSILMGFGLNSDAIHSPNEHFALENYFKGIQTIVDFYKNI